VNKPTPGPWMARQMFSGSWDIAAEDGDGSTIARTKDEANARLIAAAPDLLEACADLVQLWQDWAKDSQSLAQPLKRSIEMRVEDARAAIAKAEGRE
jgi:hypothetical protein